MKPLTKQKCIPCESNIPPMSEDEIKASQQKVPEWDVVDVENAHHLKRSFKFENFTEALSFTNKIGELAEEQGHHPVIELTWGRVTVEWWTHNIGGLHNNDFIMAAKTSQAFQNRLSD